MSKASSNIILTNNFVPLQNIAIHVTIRQESGFAYVSYQGFIQRQVFRCKCGTALLPDLIPNYKAFRFHIKSCFKQMTIRPQLCYVLGHVVRRHI